MVPIGNSTLRLGLEGYVVAALSRVAVMRPKKTEQRERYDKAGERYFALSTRFDSLILSYFHISGLNRLRASVPLLTVCALSPVTYTEDGKLREFIRDFGLSDFPSCS